jgi:hypothetical protein
MKKSLFLFTMSLLTLTAALAAAQEPAPLGERRVTVGKWPEGVVVTAEGAWVAESGQRKLTLYAPDGAARQSVKIGRLPTSLALAQDGAVLALVVTDKLLKRVDPKTKKATTLAKLPDYGEEMITSPDATFVLLWEKDSSVNSSILRIGAAKGKPQRSAPLGENADAICRAGDEVWVAHAHRLSSVNAQTLALNPEVAMQGYWREIACDARAVFVASGPTLARVDVAARKETARVTLERRAAAMATRGDALFVALDNGEVLRLDAATLAIQARRAPAAPASPRTLRLTDDALWMTSYDSSDTVTDTGELLQAPLF